MLAVFVIPALVAWTSNGAPTNHADLSVLVAAILSGIMAFLKEVLGAQTPTTTQTSEQAAAEAGP
jgi:hypothetical protein